MPSVGKSEYMSMSRRLPAMLGFAHGAVAADLGPYRQGSVKDAPPPIAYGRPFSWTGLYVGAQIGIHNPQGEKVGRPGPLRNTEFLFLTAPEGGALHLPEAWRDSAA